MKPEVRIEDDKCYVEIPVDGKYYKKQLVMTKEAFIECYNKWIKESEDGRKNFKRKDS